MVKIQKLLAKYKFIILLLLVIFLAVKPLLHPGLPPTHDGEYHVIRFYEFDKSFRDGSLYPRWAKDLNNEYGVPLFNYVYPLPNYAATLFHAFNISFIDSFKLSLAIATLIGVLFFYFWAKLYFNNLAAFTAAVFYTFAPYRFVDIYVRGSVGEVWALAWFPAFLWAITSYIKNKQTNYFVLSAIFFALTIFSHNILGLMFACFGFFYIVFCLYIFKAHKNVIIFSLLSLLMGLSLSAVFWLPALTETKYVKNLQLFNVDNNFPELYQLIFPSWGTGFSESSSSNQMSFQIGIANLIAVFIGFILLTRSKYLYFLLWFLLTVFLMLGFSKNIWHSIPLLNYFQFPWRFLSLTILLCSFIAGAVIDRISNKKFRVFFSVSFIFLAIALSILYTKPAYYHYRSDEYYITRDNFIHSTNSQGDLFNTIWIDKKLPLKKDRVEIVTGKGKMAMQDSRTSSLKFLVNAETNVKILANIAYFPNWQVRIDGKNTKLIRENDGTMSFFVSKGNHSVVMHFGDTIIRTVGSIISITSLVVCILLLSLRKKLKSIYRKH